MQTILMCKKKNSEKKKLRVYIKHPSSFNCSTRLIHGLLNVEPSVYEGKVPSTIPEHLTRMVDYI